MKKILIALSVLLLAACSEQPKPNDIENIDVKAFLKTFDCKKLEQFKFENEELERRTRIHCAMKSEHTPSKPERHTFG